ncbi:lipoprotein [Acidomonas methanolica]|uniref:Lipoprotein n=1 Tax=Acidomonas methanolica NBRC 104435 TaxID=1231351 RepID=A0A023D764_ACIMT|nr:lipoprotein [Acidomonas methanolica]MBU2654662.1 hypothetical protein [Acidomonas methanolica]TCS27337.1 LPS-assembly lipoprotein [Acidomonas methanolica]GAJ29988.1 hypothetical protein Amme_093_012 [Acidomonas methanolica NBRC 104435]GBQ48978.1 hypothetical protein AA0498_0874 [Acidomonas methanolica]GEK99638.1 hypothetical protein AME01nite_21370 [Acidomonas methanolica NBRC 104435]
MRRALPLLLLLGGCGFQPLYGQQGSGVDAAQQLQDVYVANIPGRAGQELRLALQETLGGASQQAPEGYTLRVAPGFGAQSIDIHPDNTSGRMRETGSAHWQLYTVADIPVLLAEGDASTLDGINTQYEQYFALTLNHETAQGRVAKTLATDIAQQVAVWFRSHVKPAQANMQDRASYFDPNGMPTANGQPTQKAGPDGVPAAATGRDGSPLGLSAP